MEVEGVNEHDSPMRQMSLLMMKMKINQATQHTAMGGQLLGISVNEIDKSITYTLRVGYKNLTPDEFTENIENTLSFRFASAVLVL